MSKPRYKWWGYAKWMVRVYPELKQELLDHQQNETALPISCLPPAKRAIYEAVSKAIEQTEKLPTGKERMKLVSMVFWKQSHTLAGAGFALGYSYESARIFHGDFLRLVGFYRGLED